MRERVRRNAIRFLNRDVVQIWPRAAEDGLFRWEVLVAGDGRAPEAADESAFDSQFWTANVNPTDRYVLSAPGTVKHRLSPLDNSFGNLTVAGDWTHCGHNMGCVESAVISGRVAAHAISGSPALESIIGYDHP
ncbi:MAG: FAD-dependent oxidoreductase [Thermoanaerobaculia bacterium]|nr:FAD-dependent oxidoreductase [Thermoanaerobaculia bacterium]